jgi:hypothetical protein
MRVITRKRLNYFADKHPDAKTALVRWHDLMNGMVLATSPTCEVFSQPLIRSESTPFLISVETRFD